MPYTDSNYTIQFWYKAGKAADIIFECDTVLKTLEATTEWDKYVVTFTATSLDSIKISLQPGEYWFYNMKAEKGIAPTDWSANPDDNIDLYDGLIDELQQKIISFTDEIRVVESKVDKQEMSITNKLEITDFEAEINGIYNSLDKVQSGDNKWSLSVYDIDDFSNFDDFSSQQGMGLVTSDGDVIYSETAASDNENNQTEVRDLYDITIFSGANANVAPEQEILIDDNRNDMVTSVNTNNKITQQVILNFVKGWNLIEIVANNGGACFGINISEHENCAIFNCLMAVPNSRSVKIRKQFSYLNQYIDSVEIGVGQTISELETDINGRITTTNTNLATYYTQTMDMFSWILEDGSSVSQVTLTDQLLQAIVGQFQVVDPTTGQTVVISNGTVNANTISAAMLNTDAITSRNYSQTIAQDQVAPFYSTAGSKLDLANGNIITKSLYVDATTGNAWFRGNIYATNGTFNGTVYATDGEFSGTIESTEGHIGSWNIEEDFLWLGSDTFSDPGAGNIYLGSAGLSLSNKFIYNATTDTLTIAASSVEIGGTDSNEIINSKINDIKIGGRNLLHMNDLVAYNSNLIIDDYTVNVTTAATNRGIQIKTDVFENMNEDYCVSFKFRITEGTLNNLTISGNVQSNSYVIKEVIVDGDRKTVQENARVYIINNITDTEWHTVSCIVNKLIENRGLYLLLNGATSTVKAELIEMQVENGTKASGWNPSPEETMERIYEASREASDHFWIKTTNPDSGMYISKLPLTEDTYASRAGGNIVLTSNGMDIYNGTTKLATYGSSTLFYIPGTTDVATTLNSTGLNITSGSIELGTLSQPDYMYLGPNGFSLYNKLKYDPDTGLLQLNVDKLSIANDDINSLVSAYEGSNVYYATTLPTVNNYPCKTWMTEEDKIAHINDLCYDMSTGRLYKFKKTERKIKITFSANSKTQSTDTDYLWIYYQKDNAIYRYSSKLGGTTIAGTSVVIPAESFWIWWHTSASTTDYGFTIDSIEVTSDDVSTTSSVTFPNYTPIKLPIGRIPETNHPYGNNENYLWYVRPNLSGGSYAWEEVSISESNLLSLSQLTGDASITNKDYITTAKFESGTNYIRIPNTVMSSSKAYTISLQFKKIAGTISNFYISCTDNNIVPYYAMMDSTNILGYINTNKYSLTNNTTAHTLKLKINKTGTGYIDIFFNYELTTSVTMELSKIMVIDGINFPAWSPSSEDLLNSIVYARKAVENYMYYDSTYGLVIYNGRNSYGSLYTLDGITNTVDTLTVGNVRLTSSSLDIYKGNTLLVSYGETTNFYKSGSTDVAAQLDRNGLHIANGSITLGTGFSATSAGYVVANNALIGGFKITDTVITSDDNKTDSSTATGHLTLSSSTFTRSINSISRSNLKFAIGGNFGVNSDGYIFASNADISGKITATSGSIGTGNYKIELGNGTISYGMTSYDDSTHNGFFISSSGIALGKGAFKVTSAGVATVSGSITATEGYIGTGTNKITLGNGILKSGVDSYSDTAHDGFYLGPEGLVLGKGVFKVSNKGVLSATSGTFSGSLDGATGNFTGSITATSGYIGSTGNGKKPIVLGDGFIRYGKTGISDDVNDGFYIDSVGITASNVNLTGEINATSGMIGNGDDNGNKISIGNGCIYYGMSTLGNTSSDGFYLGTKGIALGKGAFKVTAAGEATVKGTITATGGYIGSGDNKIEIGAGNIHYNMTSLGDTTHDGFYIGTNGISLGKGAFKVTDAGVLTTTSGYIGKTGTGKKPLELGDGYIRYGRTDMMDTANSGFYICANGINANNVKLTGDITATTGIIGNFYISSNGALYSNINRPNYNDHTKVGLTLEPNGFLGMKSNSGFIDLFDGIVFTGHGNYRAALLGSVSDADNASGTGSTGLSIWNGTNGQVFSVNASSGDVTAKGTVSCNTISCTNSISSGSISTGSITSDSSITCTSISSTGNISSGGNISASGTLSCYNTLTVNDSFSTIFKVNQTGLIQIGGSTLVDTDGYLYDRDTNGNRFKLSVLYEQKTQGSSIRFKDVSRTLLSKDIENFYSVKPVLAKYKQTYLSEDHYWQGVEMPMLIAEDIEKVYPGAVMYDTEGNINNYSDHLVVSVHQQMLIDQKAEIESLKAEISKLKKLIERM